ncbi:unnamed protein product [Rhizophagus irregularis]|nr:unnamed protein product [Rhizophagus irregularis]
MTEIEQQSPKRQNFVASLIQEAETTLEVEEIKERYAKKKGIKQPNDQIITLSKLIIQKIEWLNDRQVASAQILKITWALQPLLAQVQVLSSSPTCEKICY